MSDRSTPTWTRPPGTLIPGADALDAPSPAGQTIRRTPAAPPGSAATPIVLAPWRRELQKELEDEGELGRGGVGIVRQARQPALGRSVAVKGVHPDAPQHAARRSLMREAWAAAQLEHPNIVPVYDIAVDADNAPHVLMRRIQGRTWAELLANPDEVRSQHGVRDVRAWHLGVLQQVCNAVHYAHSTGVLHRDLKPDNVMIGGFGEVYVLDWGLVVRFGGHDDGRLPLAQDANQVVGTPRFMAPEMARGDAQALGPPTDVYLLGGLLHCILAERGPHPGHAVEETLAAIPTCAPTLPDDTPHGLAELTRRCLAKQPGQRPATADAVRHAIQQWQEAQVADQAADEATHQLRRLHTLISEDDADHQDIYRRFGAARFGYQQALRAWPDHAAATAGLHDAIIIMARYELDHGDPRAAATHLAELEHPPEDLLARRASLLASKDLDDAQLQRRLAELDPTTGQRTRIFVAGVVMASWVVNPFVLRALQPSLSRAQLVGMAGITFLSIAAIIYWARDSMGRTRLNRQVAGALLVVPLILILQLSASPILGLNHEQEFTIGLLVFCGMSTLASVTLSRWAAPAAIAYGVGFVFASVYPEWVHMTHALCNLVLALGMFAAWAPAARGQLFRRTPDEREAAARRDRGRR